MVPIPPGKVLIRVGGFEPKGDEVSFRLQGIVQLGEQRNRAVPAVHGVPHTTREGLLAEEGAVGTEEGDPDIAATGVGDTHVVHLTSRFCVGVETSVHSVAARESCLWQLILVVHWEVHSCLPKGERKAKVVVWTIYPL